MNRENFGTLMYALTKEAARYSFVEFLENWDLTEEEYGEIKSYLEKEYGIELYL